MLCTPVAACQHFGESVLTDSYMLCSVPAESTEAPTGGADMKEGIDDTLALLASLLAIAFVAAAAVSIVGGM